ncbi:MAG: 16S rRNA (cytosine(1402)-N(4))-methyltransferase RsmH [Smithellaceae bacterium]|nr:16S rRNA (cytosine(1402)-N(4))-methyltransferase RsmH [Smithellaceae bacterium]
MTFYHQPIMAREVVASLNCKRGGIYVDGTVGGGGHSLAILKATEPDGIVIGIDTDDEAIAFASERLCFFGDRARLRKANFSSLDRVLDDMDIRQVDGIILDVGVSSHQLESASRGFSFALEGPLDMRMDTANTTTAAHIVNNHPEEELKRIIREYGEEPMARRIARAIVIRRQTAPIETTAELASLIASAISGRRARTKIHPATKTFQALRIAVNDELSNLSRSLTVGVERLLKDGRFSVITFHSLEDRIVKETFRSWEGECVCPPDLPVCNCTREAKARVITRKPIVPQPEEIASNPRARSAKLRTAARI